MVRYAGDFVILCRTAAEAEQALAVVQEWVAEARLTLHPTRRPPLGAGKEHPEAEGHATVEDPSQLGRFARPVRREGRPNPIGRSYPYPTKRL